MLTTLRRALLLLASVALVVGLGVVAAWGHLTTAGKVDTAQRADRLRLERTLAGLTRQYLQFAMLDTAGAAGSQRWNLRRDDAADQAALTRAVRSSHLASYGASLTAPSGVPLTSFARGGLPSPADPGFEPLRAALASGKPGLSDVIRVGDTPLVAFGAPVKKDGRVAGLLLAYADVRSWPLQGYDATIELGESATPSVLDSRGSVAASNDVASVGLPVVGLPAVVTAGGSGVTTVERGGETLVASYAPVAFGWTTVTTQRVGDFTSGLQERSRRDALLVVVLLTVVVALLVGFNHSRQHALRRLADERLHDPLTRLPQRRLFALRLETALARQRRSGLPLTVLYCDLDGFKGINDTYGHNAGDQVLGQVARRLTEATRADDLVARLGGDEFVVLLEGADHAEAAEVVRRIGIAVSSPLAIGGTVLRPGVSVGGAVLRDAARADDLLAEADLAMYRVKRGDAREPLIVLERSGAPAAAESSEVTA